MILSALCFCFILPLCQCLFVEISLMDKNESRNVKLVCGPPETNRNLVNKNRVLWQGSKFGNEEQQKLAEIMNTDALVPNISVNSSRPHSCYLLADNDTYGDWLPQKKRVSRQFSASIPMENGICPPGYRIDQDRCFECFPGSYTSGQNTECFLCPKDFYVTKRGADSCWPCPDGSRTKAQGADSEDSCLYFDENGNPILKENPPWILIFSLVGVFILISWIILIILCLRYWREDDTTTVQVEKGINTQKKPLLSIPEDKSEEEHMYESISESSSKSDPDDHLYAEIGDFDDLYEIPRKPGSRFPYDKIDIHRTRSLPSERGSIDEDLYEIPKRRSTDNQLYEVPRRKSEDSDRNEEFDSFYDDILYLEADNDNESRKLSKTRSQGFEPEAAREPNWKRSAESQTLSNIFTMESYPATEDKPTSKSWLHSIPQISKSTKTRSSLRMTQIPEERNDSKDMDSIEDGPLNGASYDDVTGIESEYNEKMQAENKT